MSRTPLLLVALITAGNVAYLLSGTGPGLSPDEAHYFDWSRRLDWSYYSKGPLVAWLIRASCALFGETEVAVRMPAVACHALLLLALNRLATGVLRSRLAGVGGVLLAEALPPWSVGALLTTIDAPFLAAWAWACVFARRALASPQRWPWAAAGACVAVGVLAKYLMLLFPVCLAGLLLTSRGRAVPWGRLALLVAVSLVGTVPIVAWNAANGWPGLRHVATQAGLQGGDAAFDPVGPLAYLGGQFALLLGYWFIAWLLGVARPGGEVSAADRAFLTAMSLPIVAGFAAVSLWAKVQPNWPAAGYVTGFVLALAWLRSQLFHTQAVRRKWARGGLACAIAAGGCVSLVAHWPNVVRPGFARLMPTPTAADPTPVRRLDPTCRLAGWPELARAVDTQRRRLRDEEGVEPALAAMNWTVPGELAFYCDDHPAAYSFGTVTGGRFSQYDVWRPNPVADAQVFEGRAFVYVGEAFPDMGRAFDRIEGPVEVIASDGPVPVARWTVWVLRGFRGFGPPSRPPAY